MAEIRVARGASFDYAQLAPSDVEGRSSNSTRVRALAAASALSDQSHAS